MFSCLREGRLVNVLVMACMQVSAGLAFGAGVESVSHDGLWHAVAEVPQAQRQAEPWVRPAVFQAVRVDQKTLSETLAQAPLEFTKQARQAPLKMTLPMPDGSFARFLIVESPIMEPPLAAKFPLIKTYSGYGVDDPAATARLDRTPAGFHAQVLSPNGTFYIDPYTKGDTTFYASYYKHENPGLARDLSCMTEADIARASAPQTAPSLFDTGDTLRTYRLACAATGEYTQFHGGTVAAGMAAIVTAVNRVTGVYEVEMAIRMVLVADNDMIVYTNGAADPYTNSSGYLMLSENQSNLNMVIGSGNYDIGHVFSTGGGGIASLRVPCTSSKARGVTGSPSPIGDAFYIDYVAHEMGHQFGGNHTFNGIDGNCAGGNRVGAAAYEPGSGSTIMAYAGICGADDLQNHSDPYFHSESYVEIIDFVTGFTGSSCAVTTSTGNVAPAVDAGPDFYIPMGTPFVLTASGSDAESPRVTYCWEERDLGPAQLALGMTDNGSSPLFRSFDPTFDESRMFPRLTDILDNATTIGEVLPSMSRTMDFRVTVRDRAAGGGGVSWDDMQVFVDGSRGPFRVTAPNEPGSLAGASDVTWDVAGTDGGTINTTEVNILLSTDGGLTFPTTVAANTPNDGVETVTFPSIQTTTARIKIEAVGNIFFDISDADFAIDLFNVPAAPPWPHSEKKNRYISFDPNNASANVAFQLAMTDGPGETGVLGWVGVPYDASCFYEDGSPTGSPCTNEFLARVVAEPVFRAWTEEIVQVADCEIVPTAVYQIRASGDGASFSFPFEVSTIDKPIGTFHGDIVGFFFEGFGFTGPQGIINVTDIQALLFCIQDTAAAPHLTWCDIHGLGIGSPPNFIPNVSDVQQILKGAKGLTFLESNPDNRNPSDCP